MTGSIYIDANDHLDLTLPTELGEGKDLEKQASKVLLLNPPRFTGNFYCDTMAIAEDYFSQKE
tara:strand:- start:196 stop:384 length:189 start_codon:yes stop_codon:yes gene_type:complete